MIKNLSLRDIIGVYEYMPDKTMGELLPPVEHEGAGLDDDLYCRWVEAHQVKFRPALKTLKSKITHVSHHTFIQSLKFTLFNFNNVIAVIDDFCCVCLVQTGKSQKWVTEIARTLDFKAREYLCLGEQGADNLEFSLSFTSLDRRFFKHIVIMDDGSFSGNQMANNILRACHILRQKFDVDPFFHILIPYVTETAYTKITNLSQSGIRVRLYHAEIMPVIAQVVNRKTLPLLVDVLWPEATTADEKNSKACSTALYWFDHNIPNGMSFPSVVAEGIVKQPLRGGSENFRFLPHVRPPYKSMAEESIESIN